MPKAYSEGGVATEAQSILLIAPWSPYGLVTEYPRLSLAYLAANLAKAGIPYDILDLNFYGKQWKETLGARLRDHTHFGITATTGDMSTVPEMACFIKSNRPKGVVILGGVHATLRAQEVLEANPAIDYCFRGEAEEAIVKLMSRNVPSTIEGFCYRDHGQIIVKDPVLLQNLNGRPFPNYDKFELDRYYGNTRFARTVYIMTSRGCPYQCIYCSKGLGHKFRARNAEDVVAEMLYLKERYRVARLMFADDNFTLNLTRAKEICRLMITKKVNMPWIAAGGLRVDRLDDELLQLMKKSGCGKIALGIESSSDRILAEYKKGTTRQLIVDSVRLIKKHNIRVAGYFLIGAPSESREDILASMEFAKELDLDDVAWSILIPYPDTEIWQWIEANDLWTVDDPLQATMESTTATTAIYQTPLLSAQEKLKLFKMAKEDWARWQGGRNLRLRTKHWLIRHRGFFRVAKKIQVLYYGLYARTIMGHPWA